MYEIQSVANYHCRVGENPLYDEREQRIYWEDIDTGRLFRADHRTLEHECFYQGDVIGGFTFQEDGSLLLFEANRIATLDAAGRRRVLAQDIDPDMARFNDVIADPEGRVYAGTIGRNKESGGLYRVDLDGRVSCLFKGSGCANGMAFTPDLTKFYWTCSTRRTVFLYDYARDTGALSNERLFYQAAPGEGTPDGLTIDTDGNIWSARWDGSVLLKFSPEAELLDSVRFPVAKVSSAAFGGPEFDTLYVTTAGGREGSETADGTLYRVPVAARGRPEFRSRVML
ncbi:MAG TPA: SMP-30/gluconolactonase/LRE family protein [Polyangiaceae bacterium]|jgi:D-xylonolactonase|nr:SMP-30/gluconolactonase/LRE family protein [Polyangiaceae bacterium]